MAIYVYNSGNSTQGVQVQDFYSRIAHRKINQAFNFSKFSNRQDMMKQHSGDTYKTSTYFWSIHREVIDADGNYTGVQGGYITERDMKDIETKLNGMEVTQEGVYKKSDIFQLGTFRKVTFQTKLKKFAGMKELTEDAETYSEDAVRTLALEDMVMQLNDTYNSLMIRDILNSTFKVYGGTATTRDEVGGDDDTQSRSFSLTEGLTQNVYGKLLANKAKPVTPFMIGSDKVGSRPLPGSYFVIVGHNLHVALTNKDLFPEFQPIEEYSNKVNPIVMEGLEETGRIGRFRILYSETMPNFTAEGALVDGTGDDPSNYCHSEQDANGKYRYNVYPAVVMSRDAISTVGLEGKTKHMIYTQFPEQVDGTNPIGERGYMAFKFRYATIITRPDNLAVMELTCPTP